MSNTPELENTVSWSCPPTTTQTDWLDENGHVNVRFYLRMVAEGSYHVMDEILTGGARPEPPPKFFTLQANILYKSEMRAGQPVLISARPYARSEKTLSMLIRIVKDDPDRTLSAECEWTGGYVDPATRRMAPLPIQAREIIDAKIARADAASGPYASPRFRAGIALPDPPPEKLIESSSGVIDPEWIDRMGHMGIEHYMLIFSASAGGYFNALGFGHEIMREHGWGAFGMGSKIRFMRELKAGEPYRVITTTQSVGRKTIMYRHTIWTTDDKPVDCATCDHTSAIVDWSTRRTIPTPDFVLGLLGERHGVEIVRPDSSG